MKKIVFLLVVLLIATTVFAQEMRDFVIAGQFAFSGEGKAVIAKMQQEGGEYWVIPDEYGREWHVLNFAKYSDVTLVYGGTFVGMQNASKTTLMQLKFEPDVALHSGICGNINMEQGWIGDVYVNTWWANAGYGRSEELGTRYREYSVWDPNSKKHRRIALFRADQRLVDLAAIAFETFEESSDYAELNKILGRPDNHPIRILRNHIGLSSDWFVASSETVFDWSKSYRIFAIPHRTTIGLRFMHRIRLHRYRHSKKHTKH